MALCKPCNRFYSEKTHPDGCPSCAKALLARAMPYRASHPQHHTRCHDCWNLTPVCTCRTREGSRNRHPSRSKGYVAFYPKQSPSGDDYLDKWSEWFGRS